VEVFFLERLAFWEVGEEPAFVTSCLFIISPHTVFGLLGCPTLHPVCDPAELADSRLADVFVVDCHAGEAQWHVGGLIRTRIFFPFASLQVSDFFENSRVFENLVCFVCVCDFEFF
jgi:hypothetical protein